MWVKTSWRPVPRIWKIDNRYFLNSVLRMEEILTEVSQRWKEAQGNKEQGYRVNALRLLGPYKVHLNPLTARISSEKTIWINIKVSSLYATFNKIKL